MSDKQQTKGKDFENCLMYVALKRSNSSKLSEYESLYKKSNQEVSKQIDLIMNQIVRQINPRDEQEFYKSFIQLGGSNPEPKTDILFLNQGIKYKCSMKWGPSFRLSSAGIEGSINFLLKSTEQFLENKGIRQKKIAFELINLIEELQNEVGGLGTQTSTIIQSKLKDIRNIDVGIQAKFQQILGSPKVPIVSEVYFDFKKFIIEEAITGNLTFGNRSDNSANYVLSAPKYSLKEITNSYIEEISNKSSIRIGAKGRSTPKELKSQNIRRQEIVINFDVKD